MSTDSTSMQQFVLWLPPQNCFVFVYFPPYDNFVYRLCLLSSIMTATQWSRNWICSLLLGQKWRSTSSVPSGQNTYLFPKLCVVFITLWLRQSPEIWQHSAVRAIQNWPVHLYKFTSSSFSPDITIKCFGANDNYSYLQILLPKSKGYSHQFLYSQLSEDSVVLE